MKKILVLIMMIFVISSCGEEKEIESEVVKSDFNIDAKNIGEFLNTFNLEKTGKLSSSQAIKLSSHVSGRVSNVYVVEGEKVNKGDIIARLEDNIANYGLSLERAQNSLNKAEINYESTENSLNKNISDLKINIKSLKIDESNSKSSLELEKLENSIKKIALDYDNLKISNSQSISGFKNSMGKELTNFTLFIDNVIDFSDKILGVTTKNRSENDKFDNYLGAKDTNQKGKTDNLLRELIDYRKNNLTEVSFLGNIDFNSNIKTILEGYSKINSLLVSFDITLDNSISSQSSFSESQITNYRVNIDTYNTVYNGNNGGFIGLTNSINSFLETYRNNEDSLLKQIELIESDKKIYINGLDTKLEIDESTLEEAIKNKGLTLRQLDTVIVDANIAYEQALSNVNKLGVRSPITGNIGEIFIDVGQEVGGGTQLFNLSNNSNNEVNISFSKDELNMINVGNIAFVNIGNDTYTGSIKSISSIADSNLKYITKIGFDNDLNFIGDIVNVIIPVDLNKTLVPLTLFSIKKDNIGLLNILEKDSIKELEVYFGKFYGDLVEIKGCVNLDIEECNNIKVIINDVSKFDKEKFNLMIK